MKVYAFSGLGADGRIFNHLNLNHELIRIEWITPKPKESLSAYAGRLGEQINPSEPHALLGVSFGGMLATELSRITHPDKVILISSSARASELPLMAHISRTIKLHRIIPSFFLKPPTWFADIAFVNNSLQREVAKGIIRDMDPNFIKWALGAIVNWRNSQPPERMIHIHGKRDLIIPYSRKMNAEPLGKGHFIILRNAREISQRVNEFLKS